MTRKNILARKITLLPAVLTLSLMPSSVGEAQPVSDAVGYTDPQAAAGKVTYERSCASCHGVNLEGAAEVLARLSPVTDEMLSSPPAEDWLLWQQNYDNLGFSSLDQINRETVAALALSWRMPLQTGANNPGPIIHDGIMFVFTFPDTVLAIDAVNGSLLWRYEHQSDGPASQKKGIALHGDRVYVPTSDLHVLALEASTGKPVWDHEIETEEGLEGYHLRMSPMVIGDTVIQGITSLRIAKGG
jgi:alcohol dehydrogenase (cytochrome c)